MDRYDHGPKISDLKEAMKDVSFDLWNSIHYWRHNLKGNRVEKKFFSGKSLYPPVILLQGFMGTRGVLKPLENYLRDQGRDVISLDLGVFNIQDIKESAHLLNEKIEKLIERFARHHPVEKIDIVGHSMGGLIGLYYLKRLGGYQRLNRLVALGAPFNGTWATLLAMLPFGAVSKGLWQMLPTSDFLYELKAHPAETHDAQIFSIAAKYDAICPPKSCHLDHARNITIPVGHGGLLMDLRVFEKVTACLSPAKNQKVHNLHLRTHKK